MGGGGAICDHLYNLKRQAGANEKKKKRLRKCNKEIEVRKTFPRGHAVLEKCSVNVLYPWELPRFDLMPHPTRSSTADIPAPSRTFFRNLQASNDSTRHPISAGGL